MVIPRHFVLNAKQSKEQGKEVLRPTRITDVRKWLKEGQNVAPSVTTAMDVLAKHALINWKIEQHIEQAYLLDPANYQHSWMYQDAVRRNTDEAMEKAPQAGTDFHKEAELFMSSSVVDESLFTHFDLLHKANDLLYEKTESDIWNTEINFVSQLGYGGQVDLTNSEDWVIDYKTKQLAEKFKPGRMAYDDHRIQLAAYREGIGMPKARCANVFVCLEDGQIDFHEHKEEDLQKGWSIFQHALAIWKLQAGL